jgi:multidrug efflux pump subunit AcrA (membrane-fusion protein)
MGAVNMQNKIILSISLLTVLVFSSGCGKIEPGNTDEVARETIKATIAVTKVAPSLRYYEAVGTVRAKTTSTLSGKLMGTVKAVNVREGDAIKKGRELVVIDERQVAAQLSQAKAAIEEAKRTEIAAVSARDAAQAGADLAQAAYKRYLKLIDDNAVSRQEFDSIEMRARQADAGLKQAEAVLEGTRQKIRQAEAAAASAEVSRKDAVIMAPYDGIITGRMIEPGDLAAPGSPFLVIEQAGGLEVDVIIPEGHIHTIKQDQALDVIIPDVQEKALKGTVSAIVPSADPQSRSFIVKVALPVHEGIRSGVFARVNIPLGDESMVLLPASAIVNQGQLTGLFIVEDNGIARFRLIRTGRKTDGLIEVVSGLKDGVRYLVSPPPKLKDGMRVEASS